MHHEGLCAGDDELVDTRDRMRPVNDTTHKGMLINYNGPCFNFKDSFKLITLLQ